MDIGIGLPATIPGADPTQVLEAARRAERLGFASVGVIDRVAYDNHEPLITLAAVAAVTERVRLVTSILLAPLRVNTVLLAKQAATLDRFAKGRLVLGMAVGLRQDDYQVCGIPMGGRGRRFEAMLTEMRRVWSGEVRGEAGPVGPRPPRGEVTIIIGGGSDTAHARAARFGAGWIASGSAPPDRFGESIAHLRRLWADEGRQGEPRVLALTYFALGPDASQAAGRYLSHYYGHAGVTPETAQQMALTGESAVREAVAAYRDAGCDELLLFPCSADPVQVDLLAPVTLR
ncbi:Flavin-dependent oxidoreductase, luciferase family (includes alkanesulfonate monooxygenase SsuD and methylene tetrahydromethanopterin reductase) [Streptoalloteichus tenebrarius]|uniref:Flavin-dependent oxidoreductase, luciferase family (Includes alkanesulfonate monooxygenase SsuD and methylene tetrahydromethanopterin reductase) n=1 Tax=Streptoalloteichus tenebrarius (strain ATCC 17920 / DSM 40477 / JCM 4838 / CBS 697.72 / NBRC 16177 / NCIMB 11028 / NRRL B-12390 / A12253. 1 / ISP 5477) TaxID=1933 RepID=A0ABT1HPT7_STRSD|nr:LLM class flavin-dependent oxidoreductase [Streptoalloteichus tenebrarius]MCP2257480.1 Flavin-dependent oxidoreductase, luciferase family (includes alkanesulfonate monooxygenase SsuD and methylene tetrahydromethanopterin reductase) [Streptoalloteichus tenebrarius]BFE98429.1 LLM class flavin-dependent oxidoreductase [Streptoalloteichus tenebrarius]